MKKHIQKAARYLAPRKAKSKSWNDVSNFMVLLLGLTSAAGAAYYNYGFGKFAPEFVEIVNKQPLQSLATTQLVICAILLSAIGVLAFIWSIAAAGMATIIVKRAFGV